MYRISSALSGLVVGLEGGLQRASPIEDQVIRLRFLVRAEISVADELEMVERDGVLQGSFHEAFKLHQGIRIQAFQEG